MNILLRIAMTKKHIEKHNRHRARVIKIQNYKRKCTIRRTQFSKIPDFCLNTVQSCFVKRKSNPSTMTSIRKHHSEVERKKFIYTRHTSKPFVVFDKLYQIQSRGIFTYPYHTHLLLW